jgi:hypothetical protein
MLEITNTAGSNSGAGYLSVRLRPCEKSRGNASKRGRQTPENAAAQNPYA